MTNTQINEAIAEACGWTGSWHHLPDYCGSLDAMWEAEACLTPDQQDDFAYYLSEIVAPITGEPWKSIHSSAMSRAKAFLRTVGKWKEGK